MATHISLFPNPAEGFVTVQGTLPGTAQTGISIADITGRTVKEIEKNTASATFSQTINLEGMASGIYFVKIWVDEKPYVKKLIIP